MAHELAHVQNRDILIGTIAATFAGAISMIGNMLQWGAMFGAGRSDDEEGSGGLIGSLVMAIIAPIAAMLIQMAVSRSREYLADETGARHLRQTAGPGQCPAQAAQRLSGDPDAGCRPATAHMFIVNPLTGGGLMSLFSTHPPMEERIARLESLATRIALKLTLTAGSTQSRHTTQEETMSYTRKLFTRESKVIPEETERN